MTGDSGENNAGREFTELELAAIGDYLPELRRSLSDQSILRTWLAVGLVLGLAAHIAGYMLKTATTTEPLALLADLLYGLGFALWTGVVVVLFVQILPESKRRQVVRALEAYEASRRAKPRIGE
jgi:hypothetical protein